MIDPIKGIRIGDIKMSAIASPCSPGDFAIGRSTYFHTGIDYYCENESSVYAMEAGIVVSVIEFTGTKVNPPSPWWNDTQAVMVEGKSGVILYGEIKPYVKAGDPVMAGDVIGHVIPVLKRDKGNGTTMLHIELYDHGVRDAVEWPKDMPQPACLKNPRILFEQL